MKEKSTENGESFESSGENALPGMMPVMDTAPQADEERFAFLGVQGRAAPAEG